MATFREVNESLGVPTGGAPFTNFKGHDLGYLKDLDNYPFYATLEDSIAHEHYQTTNRGVRGLSEI